MRRIPTLLLAIALTTLIVSAIAQTAPLDTSWPGGTPELFAPGVVNTDGVEINLVFGRDYTELFFARIVDEVFCVYTSRLVDGTWTAPERVELYPEGVRAEAVDMALSPDEQSLYFLGITSEGEKTQADIWVSERTDEGWSLARRLGPAVNTEHSEFYPTVVADGSLYFVSDRPSELGPRNLYRAARRADGSFEPAIPTGPPIDTELGKGDTFVAPDESYLIFSSRDRGGYGSSDLFVAFRTSDGGWTEPRNMGPVINTEELEFCPMVSPDGRWLSFSRRYGETWPTTTDAEIYWMDASIIEDLRASVPPMQGFSWVVPGKLAAMPVPGRDRPHQDAAFLEGEGIRVLVSLTEEAPDSEVLTSRGIEQKHIPVKDFTAPTLEQMIEFVEVIESSAAAGKPAGVHCTAGLGRSGTMLAVFLVAEGASAEEATTRVRELRTGSIETPAQEEAIRRFEQYLAATR